jgi:hypothetical protein
MTTMVRGRVTHHLDLGETEDPKTRVKHVHCTYPGEITVSELNMETGQHPDTHLSISLQEDIIWTSAKPFSIDLQPRDEAERVFFRKTFPWNSVESPIDHKQRVHSGALDPSALPTVLAAKGQHIQLKFMATQLVSPNGPRNDGVKILVPHVIVDP